jgi:hypothetical protein
MTRKSSLKGCQIEIRIEPAAMVGILTSDAPRRGNLRKGHLQEVMILVLFHDDGHNEALDLIRSSTDPNNTRNPTVAQISTPRFSMPLGTNRGPIEAQTRTFVSRAESIENATLP